MNQQSKAERVGFEPTMAHAILAFQASALGQTMRPLPNITLFFIIARCILKLS